MNVIKIRLVGLPDLVEAITRDLRRDWSVVAEQDYPCRRRGENIRRYVTIAITQGAINDKL